MRITSILKKLDEESGAIHQFRICADGSGGIYNPKDFLIASWTNLDELQLYIDSLSPESKIEL